MERRRRAIRLVLRVHRTPPIPAAGGAYHRFLECAGGRLEFLSSIAHLRGLPSRRLPRQPLVVSTAGNLQDATHQADRMHPKCSPDTPEALLLARVCPGY